MNRLAMVLAGVALSASAAERPSVAVLVPVADAKVTPGLSLVLQEKAVGLLMGTGRYDLVHARQVQNMARRHHMQPADLADPNVARSAAERLGVSLFVYSKLTAIKGGFSLEVSVSKRGEPRVQTSTATLSAGDAAAANEGGRQLATELVKFDVATAATLPADAQPSSSKNVAVKNYAACLKSALEQPVGIENPAVLDEVDLKKAIASCETAVKVDPDFSAAWGTLAFVSAVSGNDARAVEALGKVKADAGHVPSAMTARFWLVSRYQTSDAAEAVLKEAFATDAGFLLARVYLAELYNALGRHEEAATAWRDYAAHSEGNAFVISKLSYTLARLGKATEASTFAEKAIAFDPQSDDLALEYSSRLIDDGQVEKAITVLEPLATRHDAPAELVLRLGYAKLLKGDLDACDQLTRRAEASAKAPPEWRTRARARLNLALTALKRDKKDLAKGFTADALKEGLRPSAVPAELLALLKPDEVKSLEAKGLGKLKGRKEASPLPTVAGEVAPDAPRARAPRGFDAVRVPTATAK